MAGVIWHRFNSRDAQVASLKALTVARLKKSLLSRAQASLLVSGGSTPKPLYEALSGVDLPWNQISVALVDERWVPEDHPRSNTAFVKASLMQNYAQDANFVPMYHPFDHPCDAVQKVGDAYRAMPQPLDVVLLGMGGDGHTASLFPDAEGLNHAMSDTNDDIVAAIRAKRSDVTGDEVDRLTLTARAITSAHFAALMISGEDKAQVLEDALAGPDNSLPIARLADKMPGLLDVFWAP